MSVSAEHRLNQSGSTQKIPLEDGHSSPVDPVAAGRSCSDDSLKFTAECLINENKCLLQQNQELVEQNKSYSCQCIALQKKVAELEEEQIKQTSNYNDKCCDLEAKLAKIQMQAEQCEAVKQSLECDITSMKKKAVETSRINKQNQIALSKDVLLLSDDKKRLEEKIEILQLELESNEQINNQTESKLRSMEKEKTFFNEVLMTKDDEIHSLNEKLDELVEYKDSNERELLDLQQTILQRDQQLTTLQNHFESTREREKTLRAQVADLKQNAEDLKQTLVDKDQMVETVIKESLEEAVSAQKVRSSEAIKQLQVANQRADELEAQLKAEKQKVALVTSKLEESLSAEVKKEKILKELVDSKERLIQHSTVAFGGYQQQYAALQQEAINTTKHMNELNDSFVESMNEICELANTYDPNNCERADFESRKSSSSPKRKLCSPEKKDLLKDFKVFVGRLRTVLETYKQKSVDLKAELDDLNKKYKEVNSECERSRELAESRGKALQKVQSNLKSSNAQLLEIQSKHDKFEAAVQVTSCDVVRMGDDLAAHVDRCSQLQKDIETMQFRHTEELETQENFLRELYLVLSAKDGENGCINSVYANTNKRGINQLSVALRGKLDRFIALHEEIVEKVYNVERSNTTMETAISSLQLEHKESIDRFANECRVRESQSIEFRKQLEMHFEAYVDELQSKVKSVQALNDEAWARVNSSESVSSRLQNELADLQEDNAALKQHRRSLTVGCCILLGLFYPLLRSRDELGDQRQLLSRLLYSEEQNRVQLRSILNTLNSELKVESKQKPPSSFKAIHPLIRFRVAAVAVLGMNRLKKLSTQNMFVCRESSISKKLIVAYTGECDGVTKWLSSDDKLTHSLSLATQEIVELQDAKCGGSLSEKKLQDASKKTFVKIVRCSQPYFNRFTDQRDDRYHSPLFRQRDDTLIGRLRFGLHNVIRTNQIGDVIGSFSSKNSVSLLRKHFLSFTKRLHESEVQRLRLSNENSKLLHQVESRQTELSCVRTSLIELQKLERSKKSSLNQCNELTHELSSALDREKTSQELLQEQNNKIKVGFEEQTEKVCFERNKNIDTLNEAVADLTDSRLELKRNSHTIRQLEKKVEHLTSEKEELEKTVQQAKHALKKAVGERSTITTYFTNVAKTLEHARSRDVSNELKIQNDALAQQGGQGLKVATRTVDKFIRAQSGAVQRINHLETQLTSYKQHINNLKKEFHNCCLRENSYPKNIPPTRDTVLRSPAGRSSFAQGEVSTNDFSPLVPEMSVISSCDDINSDRYK